MRIARRWVEYCADDERGNETMLRIARDRFAADPTIDVVEVHECAGWWLEFNRDGMVVGTANDMACFSNAVIRWCRQWDDVVVVGSTRRPDGDIKYDSYYPCVAGEVA